MKLTEYRIAEDDVRRVARRHRFGVAPLKRFVKSLDYCRIRTGHGRNNGLLLFKNRFENDISLVSMLSMSIGRGFAPFPFISNKGFR
ncbi:MAG: hypothetical protein ACTHNZ_08350 [Trinickia sp.]|uniref:hypothetical protein n=1 Tax=Trinickia sp. TaxID=2571163 RepID=UPI003F7D9C8F